MAFTRNTLQCILQKTGVVGGSIWLYDTLDTFAAASGAGYFAGTGIGADDSLGLEKGDIIIVRTWTTALPADTVAKNAGTVATKVGFVSTMSTAGAGTITQIELPAL